MVCWFTYARLTALIASCLSSTAFSYDVIASRFEDDPEFLAYTAMVSISAIFASSIGEPDVDQTAMLHLTYSLM